MVGADRQRQQLQAGVFVARQQLGLGQRDGGKVGLGTAHGLAGLGHGGLGAGVVTHLGLCLRADRQRHARKLRVVAVLRGAGLQQLHRLLRVTAVHQHLGVCQRILRQRCHGAAGGLGQRGIARFGGVEFAVAVGRFADDALAACRRHHHRRILQRPQGALGIALRFQAGRQQVESLDTFFAVFRLQHALRQELGLFDLAAGLQCARHAQLRPDHAAAHREHLRIDVARFVGARQLQQRLPLDLQRLHRPAVFFGQHLVASGHCALQVLFGQPLVDGQHRGAAFQQRFQAVFDVAGGDRLEQVGVRLVLTGRRHRLVRTLGRHHEKQAVGAEHATVAHVLQQLLAVGLLVQVEVAQHQAVRFAFGQPKRVFSGGGLVDLGNVQHLQLAAQRGLLRGHVVDHQGVDVGIGGLNGHAGS